MNTINETYYNPSVNIVRDLGKEINYIPTPNAKLVYQELLKQYKRGTHSFSVIGAYGSGKSSFLLALEKQINLDFDYFIERAEDNLGVTFDVFPVVGEYKSIIASFAELCGLKNITKVTVKDVLDKLNDFLQASKKKGKGLAIFVDEFGKFLEYAAKHNPEADLYFIQQLAEVANNSEENILFVTTLHQGFNNYSFELNHQQQNEWNKVRGRLAELTFNEPVEQLLFLASKKLSITKKDLPSNFKVLYDTIKRANVFPLKDYMKEDVAKKLNPFDILSAASLTLSLQRYGQNQRSLFSFIDSNAYLSISDYEKKENPFYNLACVYDYLLFNYFSFISTKFNPDYAQWAAIKSSIERVEGIVEDNPIPAIKIVKTVGLLQIFGHKGADINTGFLSGYAKFSLGVNGPEKVIELLEKNKIIHYSKYSRRYKLLEGTDLNIELAIDDAGNLIQRTGNVVDFLNKSIDFPYILAKEAYYITGAPRFFEFQLSQEPEIKVPHEEIDGYVNLIFSENYSIKELNNFSRICEEAILFGWYRNTNEIKELLFEIEKIKKAIDLHKDDTFALKEFKAILAHQENLLEHYILEKLYLGHNDIIWSYRGKQLEFNNQKEFNRILSRIITDIYYACPVLKNELFNKTKISSAISVARRNLLENLIQNSDKQNLGYEDHLFPPDKTIYLTLLKNTGIHKKKDKAFILQEPVDDDTFVPLWKAGMEFLEASKNKKQKISELVEIFSSKPFKLKKGFLDYWLPIFLIANKDLFALYENGVFIPQLSLETFDLIGKRSQDYEIKAFDLQGKRLDFFNRYRHFLNQSLDDNPSNESFIETFKPFVVFYRSLPFYNKNTHQLSKKAIAFRKTLANAKDPEQVFFEEFPAALGYSLNDLLKYDSKSEEYIIQLKHCIQEINQAYDNLLNRFENYILKNIVGEEVNFPEYKQLLINRFKKIQKQLLNAKQKALIQRIKSPLDDRKSWLNSLAYALINKSLENINDEEETILHDKLKEKIHELDNLCELSKSDIDATKEEVFKIEITSFVKGLEKRLIRLPKQNSKEIISLGNEIKSKLKANAKDLNIALLTRLLQEQLNDE